MVELGVNIDHVATIRQARRTYEPDPILAAEEALLGGADGITVHLREDRRHIQDDDVRALSEIEGIPLNLEMAPCTEMVEIACALKPQMSMLVPEGRLEITTEGGLDVAGDRDGLAGIVEQLTKAGIRTSAFIDAEKAQIEAAAEIGIEVCEVHTGPYAHAFHASGGNLADPATAEAHARVAEAGELVQARGMRFNAGHALNYRNVGPIVALPGVRELHIGHAIVSRSVFVGLRNAVAEMKELLVHHGTG